jgi:hypothetical protein
LAENDKDEAQLLHESECASKWPSLDKDLAVFRAMKEREASEKNTRKRRVEEPLQ